jgi:hypothetical protein
MMSPSKLKITDYAIIAANLVPVYGVWFLGWSGKEVFIAYALETLIIGAFTVIKLAIATLHRGSDLWYNKGQTSRVSGLFFIVFFILHFGIFAAVQTSIFSAASGITGDDIGLFHFFFHWYDYIDKETGIMLISFVASYAVSDLLPFIGRGDYKTTSMMRLMFQPYGRIFVQQFIVILGSMLLMFKLDKVFILVFAAIKIYFEIYLNFERILNKTMSDLEKTNDAS